MIILKNYQSVLAKLVETKIWSFQITGHLGYDYCRLKKG